MISQRTIAGLAAAKARGVKLGSSGRSWRRRTRPPPQPVTPSWSLSCASCRTCPRALLLKRSSVAASASCRTRPSRALAFASGWRIDG